MNAHPLRRHRPWAPSFATGAVAVAAVAAALALACTDAQAQKSALVQNVDEPGRSPYHDSILFNQTDANCPNDFYCIARFRVVPAGKRLVVTYASAEYTLSANAGAGSVALAIDGNLFGPRQTLPPGQYQQARTVVAGAVTFYFEAGQTPSLLLTGSGARAGNTALAGITGYLVGAP